ncbi:MAG: histidine kinase [Polaribacter sp.]|uniref:sensor histidine kinase n=1 Tax=Polaribacter sp. TaxID=1920175 RepID=UPI003BB1E491
MKTYLLTFFLFVFAFKAYTQQPVSIHLTEKDGLPDTEFYDILEDDNGLIWLAADKGLFSYNGSEYVSYTHPKQVGLSVFALTKDKDNKIWYTNLANQVFYIENGEVHLFLNIKEYFKGYLVKLTFKNDLLIMNYINQVLICNKETGAIVYQTKNKKEGGVLFYSNPLVKNDSIFFMNEAGKYTLIDKFYKFKSSIEDPLLEKYIISSFGDLKEINHRIVVFFNRIDGTTSHYIADKIGVKTKIKTNLPTKLRIYTSILIDDKIFYATNKGVFICNLMNDILSVEQQLLPNTQVSEILKDTQGNIWLTTLGDGIYVIPNLNLKTNFKIRSANRITKLYKGNRNELFLIPKKQHLYKFTSTSQKIDTIAYKNVSELKYFFYHPKTESYFIKRLDNFLGSYQLKSNQFIFKKENTTSIIKDHSFINDNEILLASGSSIGKFLITNENELKDVFENIIRSYSCFYKATTEESFFGTVDGLFVYDKNFDKKEIKYQNNSIYIRDIISIDDDIIWCLSFKNGIYKIKDHKVIAHYTQENGLLSNINSYIQGLDANIWIAGDHGVQELNTVTNQFRNLTKKNGVPSYNFTGLEIIDDEIYLSTDSELFSFNAKTVFNQQPKNQLQPYFTSIAIDDKKQAFQNEYVLKNDKKKITINYNTNGFSSKENSTYQYRLFDKNEALPDWQINTSNNNQIIYNRLAEGDYIFQLKNKDATETSEIKELNFIVEGVFYEQLWFYGLISFGVISLFLMYSYNTNKRLKEKQRLELEKQNKEIENIFLKLESLRSQMNPHFVFNALNSIQDYIVNNQKNLAADYLGKFADLIRKYLDQSSKKEIALSEEIETIERYLELEKLRFEEKLSYQIKIQENLNIDDIFIPTVLIQPYVENALKHGLLHKKEKGNLSIEISINEEKSTLIITVIDNGVGRKKAAAIKEKQIRRHVSFATEATNKRLELLNYNKQDKIELLVEDLDVNAKDVGTKVTLIIPI